MMTRLKARLTKLEGKALKYRGNTIVLYNPSIPKSLHLALKATQKTKVMAIPSFGSDEEWEKALLRQQELLCSSMPFIADRG